MIGAFLYALSVMPKRVSGECLLDKDFDEFRTTEAVRSRQGIALVKHVLSKSEGYDFGAHTPRIKPNT
jgi:hypothetical protein